MSILKSNKIYKDLDLSFDKHPETKDVLKKVDINAVKQSMKILLFTNFGERLFRPDIGSGLNAVLFEPMDNISSNVLAKKIQIVLENNEPRVTVQRVDVIPNYDENEYEVTIFFKVLGISQTSSLSITLERLR